ncbi:FadR/GntR family transcriptional regulator [Salinarimonas ramus]|uniref:GntR family transcriptional regulator n=1 Tax=Salinarimonas ramus TaxID=690164 RepID=A0A917Q4S3_9HYPH|nr:GntR family transcriptional regulator [Salinarimonas ramus]GGK22079.1 GntR family transcriptional regulator [Salinarimonas ramus]
MAPPDETPAPLGPPPLARPRGRTRTMQVAETLKDWIHERGLEPGDRLPQERELIALFKVSRGTMREALKLLEAQGLVRVRTGPSGGAQVAEPSVEQAAELLGNYFFFKDLTIRDIYAIRKRLEPDLAASVAEIATEADVRHLLAAMTLYEAPAFGAQEERRQWIAELEFHDVLVSLAPDPLLAFVCGFAIRLLKDLAVCRTIYERPSPELRHRGRLYQLELVDALRARDPEAARRTMSAHMAFAEEVMVAEEAVVRRAFLRARRDAAPPRLP